jgi:hypothetical protein
MFTLLQRHLHCEADLRMQTAGQVLLAVIFFIIPVYLQSVQVHSVNWLKEVDECLGDTDKAYF